MYFSFGGDMGAISSVYGTVGYTFLLFNMVLRSLSNSRYSNEHKFWPSRWSRRKSPTWNITTPFLLANNLVLICSLHEICNGKQASKSTCRLWWYLLQGLALEFTTKISFWSMSVLCSPYCTLGSYQTYKIFKTWLIAKKKKLVLGIKYMFMYLMKPCNIYFKYC